TVPRTSSRPAGTEAPAVGSVITTRTLATVKLRSAGVGSSLPAWSRALTSKRWLPGASPEGVALVAEEKADRGPLASRHANRRLDAGVRLSDPPNTKVTDVALVVGPGPSLIVVSGGALSTMTVRVTARLLPARSVAKASSV